MQKVRKEKKNQKKKKKRERMQCFYTSSAIRNWSKIVQQFQGSSIGVADPAFEARPISSSLTALLFMAVFSCVVGQNFHTS